MSPEQIAYWIGKLEDYNKFLCLVPMSKEYRDTTTYRQFGAVCRAKSDELGLTDEVFAQLHKIDDVEELRWALVEIGMTLDIREMMCPEYYKDLPLNYYWMPEYKAVQDAVEAFIETQPLMTGVPDEVLLEIVRQHFPDMPSQDNAL